MPVKFSDASISKMQPGHSGEKIFKDQSLTGFAVRVRKMKDGSIKRTFLVLFQTREGGRRVTTKAMIGDYESPWTLNAARDEAKALLAARALGKPVMSPREARKRMVTVREVFKDFIGLHVRTLKPKSADEYQRMINKPEDFTDELMDTPIAELTRLQIRNWHQGFADRPYIGNRALAILSSMMTFALQRDWRTDNPCQGIQRFKERKRDDWIDDKDLPRYLEELNRHKSPAHELLLFLTVTGWRISEAQSLTWDMVDLSRLLARLPDTKTGSQTRALARDAAILLDRQPHRIGFVFSNQGGAARLGTKTIREALTSVCEAAGIARITPHALRHSAATHAAINGASVAELRDAFGWKTTAMAERYVEKAEALSRQGAEKAAGAINLFGRQAAKVVKLK